ncbi:DUF2059 domain-containing protein [Ruegeria lacuscaerulensis]|uniref:DUF2059 domain-containing protein n=1 Tax=Ruegeria lacuscaerulensis TaxID=55218 RepID=UPI00147EBAD2|nr:DUF2059 domain-containing protein [Ruegeria lacuscaerulensis]
MRLVAALFFLFVWALPLRAEDKVERLILAMQLDQVIDILRDEGTTLGQDLQGSFLNNSGGPLFDAQVERIYDAEMMRSQFVETFRQNLTDSQLDRAIVFFESDLGQTIVTLENSARVAIADEAIEEMARDTYNFGDRDTELFRLVDEFIQVNDLIEQNVRNAISADYNFFRGLSDSTGTFDVDLLAELLYEKESMTKETETWIYSFLLLAYQPLNDAQMRENIAFSRTETGRAINSAVFESFDLMYDEIYFRLGLAVSQVLKGSDL